MNTAAANLASRNAPQSGSLEKAVKPRRASMVLLEALEARVLLSGYTLSTLGIFGSNMTGANPRAPLAMDAAGDLFGATSGGGSTGLGTLFELAQGTSNITAPASVSSAIQNALNSLVMDGSGNLFGTTAGGGDFRDGSVFETTSGNTSTLASFNGSNGTTPAAGVVLDASGNLFGVTTYGGASNDGTVFAVVRGSGVITTLVTFSGANGSNPSGGLVMDRAGNLYGVTSSGGTANDGTVFEIPVGGTALTTLAAFDGANGSGPGGLIIDGGGNLYGVTSGGGAGGVGTIFEIAHNSKAITTLTSFDAANSSHQDSLLRDSDGNLFGVTSAGGVNGTGSVFELASGSMAISTLASFDAASGTDPSGLTVDAGGNIYGTTPSGGVSGDGTVFELAHGGATITTLASFDGANGRSPYGGVVIDSNGNLYGATEAGGASDDGTVFEIVHGSGTITTLASFTGANGSNPYAGVVVDGNGNLFGTTASYGASGTVFEVARGSGTITTIASLDFNFTTGVILDPSGNLYGTYTTHNSNGTVTDTVFEVARGSGIITTLASATTSGDSDLSNLVLDSDGNLYGTASDPNTYTTDGSVFEVAAASKTITTLVQFVAFGHPVSLSGVVVDASGNLYGSVGGLGHIPEDDVFESPHGSGGITILAESYSTPRQPPFFGPVTLDGFGNLYGATAARGNAGTIFELARDLPPPPTVSSFTVNDGSAQRSMVTSLTVRFDMPVVLGSQALTLTTQAGTPVPFNLNTIDNQSWNLTFTGSQLPGGSLADGHYVLAVHASQVTGTNGQPMAADQSYSFFRLFGDIDGNGTVNSADYFGFKRAFGSSGDPSLLAVFDYNGDGVVNSADYFQFKKRFGQSI